MRITPLDIRKQDFRKTMRGLDSDEVYAFLSTVAEEYEAVLSDNKKLRERIVEMEDRLEEYKDIETNLRNTLITAEKLSSEAKESAQREAGLILREAEMEAEKAAEAIRAHTRQLRHEILELKKQKDNYLTRLKTLMDSHRRMIEGFEQDFADVDREIERIGKKVEKDVDESSSHSRMSREKITEEFGSKIEDKSTWGEERKREDEERPTMPPPGKHGNESDSKDLSEDRSETPDASTSDGSVEGRFGAIEEEEAQRLSAQPIGAVDDVAKPKKHKATGGVGGESTEEWDSEVDGEKQKEDNRVQNEVAKNIEDQMYPDVKIDEGVAQADEVSEFSSGESRVGGGPGRGDKVDRKTAEESADSAPPEGGDSADMPSSGAGESPAWQQIVGEGMKKGNDGSGEEVAGQEVDQQQEGGIAEGGSDQEQFSDEQEESGHSGATSHDSQSKDTATDNQSPTGEDEQKEVESRGEDDHWKEYEVREKRTDWKEYDISENKSPSGMNTGEESSGKDKTQRGGSEAADDVPADHEVEQALSGLSESGDKPNQPQGSIFPGEAGNDASDRGDQGRGPSEQEKGARGKGGHIGEQSSTQQSSNDGAGNSGGQSGEADEVQELVKGEEKTSDDVNKEEQQPEASKEDRDGSKWTFEELKKNLSNMTKKE
jgi:cell division initiation protein